MIQTCLVARTSGAHEAEGAASPAHRLCFPSSLPAPSTQAPAQLLTSLCECPWPVPLS